MGNLVSFFFFFLKNKSSCPRQRLPSARFKRGGDAGLNGGHWLRIGFLQRLQQGRQRRIRGLKVGVDCRSDAAASPDARARASVGGAAATSTARDSVNCAVRSAGEVFTRGSIRTVTARRNDWPSTVSRT